jgi:hypothetical protein
MRKEYALEGVYQWMTHHIIPMPVLAELVVHSYPYKADIHMTLLVRGAVQLAGWGDGGMGGGSACSRCVVCRQQLQQVPHSCGYVVVP